MTPITDLPKNFELRTRPAIYTTYNIEYLKKESPTFLDIRHKMSRIEKLYSFDNILVDEYLKQNSIILDSLIVAHNKIQETFSNIIELSLEIHIDHEEDFKDLFVIIKSSDEPKKLVNLLTHIDEQWYLNLPYEIRSKFTIILKSV